MTIEDQNYRISHTANGSSVKFSYNFRILTETDLTVVVQDTSGVDSTATLTTDYSVSNVGQAGGGFVTFSTAPTNLHIVSIILDPVVKQALDLTHASTLPSQSLEDAFDVAINNVKRARDLIARSLVLQDGDVSGAGSFDANANKLTSLGTPTVATDAATKSYVDTTVASAEIGASTVVTDQAAELLNDSSYDAMLTTLGASAKGIAILKDTTNAAVLTELGVSSFAQTFLTVTAGSSLPTLGVPQLISAPNELLNGDFQVWQNGASFTDTGSANNDSSYTADQWVLLSNGNDKVDVTAQTDTLPEGGKGRINLLTTSAEASGAGRFGMLQILDNQKTLTLRQQSVGLSLQAKRTGSLTGMKAWLLSWAGTANSPTRDVVNAWNAGTTDPTFVTNWSVVGSVELAATTSWAQYGFAADVSIPADANNLAVFIATDDASWGSGDQITFSNVHLYRDQNAGNTNYDGLLPRFDSRPFEEELRSCQKFFVKTFPHDTSPGTGKGVAGSLISGVHERGGTGFVLTAAWRFPVTMLKVPTIATFNHELHGGSTAWRNFDLDDTEAVGLIQPNQSSVYITSATVGSAQRDDIYGIHATADARF
jgi:hypothetical protein